MFMEEEEEGRRKLTASTCRREKQISLFVEQCL
jgi:hypothetical protein